MSISAKDVKELRDRTQAPMMECKAALSEAKGDLDEAVKILRERGIAKAAKRSGRETTEGIAAVSVGEGNRGATAVLLSCETDFSARSDTFRSLADSALEAAETLAVDGASPEALLEAEAKDGKTIKEKLDDTANQIRENMGIAQVARHGGVCGSYAHFDGRSAAVVEVGLGDDAKAGSDELTGVLRDLCMHVVAAAPPPLAVDESGISEKELEDERQIYIKQAMDSGKPKEIAEKMVTGRMKKFVSERALLQQPFIKDPSKTVADFLEEAGSRLGTPITVKGFTRLQIGG